MSGQQNSPTVEGLYPRLPPTEGARGNAVGNFSREKEESLPENDRKSEITIQVVSTDKIGGYRRLWYKILAKYSTFSWTINKQMSEVMRLKWQLKFQRCCDDNLEDDNEVWQDSAHSIWFKLFKEEENVHYFKSLIENYLNFVVSADRYKNHRLVMEFFGISQFSFLPELGEKGREGFALKRSSSLLFRNARWIRRWFVLKKKILFYADERREKIQGVFLLDKETAVIQEEHQEDRFAVKNSSCTIYLKFPSIYDAISWRTSITENACEISRNFKACPGNSITSFAPVRIAPVKWFVDGCDYFSSVADAMEEAKVEIFISSWFLVPHVYLKRHPKIEEKWMLKSILRRKADEGVKIYVLLYDAPDGFIKLGDQYVKNTLEEQDKKNIRVLRHRGQIPGKTILWSHHEKLVIVDQMVAFVSGIDLSTGRWDTHEHHLTDIGFDIGDHASLTNEQKKGKSRIDNGQLWPGIDYTNDYESTKVKFHKPFRDHIDRSKTPRTPWHDVACVTYGGSAKDVARHFIQKWNFIKATERRTHEEIPFLIFKEYCGKGNEEPEKHLAPSSFVQVLRSAAKWSVGITDTENSIKLAYERAIEEAQHYVYIENQFFVSQNTQEIIKNSITSTLRKRILRAAQEGEKFRVYIVLPLIPMFEGDFSKADKSQQISIFAHYQYHSISRGQSSLIGSLKSFLTDSQIEEYVSFCSLRTHGKLNEKVITEVLYVHSKLLIVDDRIAIIGSPNINDRSLLGNRDSEVALWVKDREMVASTMNGRPYEAGRFAFSLRRRIFAEHLGLLESSDDSLAVLDDIVSDEFYSGIWKNTARRNTEIYDEAFRSVPSNDVKRFSQVQRHQMKEKTTDDNHIGNIRGFLVEFPMQYLEDEDLIEDRSGLLPIEIFT